MLDLGIGQEKNTDLLGVSWIKTCLFSYTKDRKDHPMERWTNVYDAGLFSCLGPQNNASFEGPMILRVNWKSVKFVIHYFLSCYLLSLARSFLTNDFRSGIPTAQWNSASCTCREGDGRSPNHFPHNMKGWFTPWPCWHVQRAEIAARIFWVVVISRILLNVHRGIWGHNPNWLKFFKGVETIN